MQVPPVITLTSDFGLKDHYVGVMKAVILNIAPHARLVDISHDIAPQDIMAAAWVTRNAAFYFPKGTIHLCVVDPGVGTSRRPIAVSINGHYFVGPDNGLFSLVAEGLSYEAYELNNTSFWRDTRSNTFHGRDIFAPVAAHLARGVPLNELGLRIDSMTYFRWATPVAVKIYIGSTILREVSSTFASVAEGEPVAFIGSSGFLEVGLNRGNAEKMLNVPKGAPVSIIIAR
jgi:S-adenosylmethionine hydrolase